MSIISSLTVTPNRVEILYRYFSQSQEDEISKDDLRQLLCPPALESGIANDVINEATRLGILEVTSRGYYHLSSEISQTSLTFLEWIEPQLLDPVQAKKIEQPNFPYALAWLLEQDPAEPFEFGDNISDLITDQCGAEVGAFEMTNRARSQNFVHWGQYLGYTWRLGIGRVDAIMPDPTRAIERHLSHVLAKTDELVIDDLLNSWASRSPVLEGGVVRQKVRELCGSQSGPKDARLLSRSTSLALLRLEERGVIKLERRADALAYTLNTKPSPRPISHIVWQGGK